MVVRVSRGRFPLERLDEVERLGAESEAVLRDGLLGLSGLIAYHVGVDREQGSLIM